MSDMNGIQCTSAVSVDTDSRRAWNEVLESVRHTIPSPDLLVVFAPPSHFEFLETNPDWLAQSFGTEQVLGCTAESVVHGTREYEAEPAVVAWAARLPGSTVQLHHMRYDRVLDGGLFVGAPPDLATGSSDRALLLMLVEPLSFPADVFLARTNPELHGVPVVGGVASAAPGSNRLLVGRQVHEEGAAVAVLSGPLAVDVLVSQGCRPIGEPSVVTKSQANEIWQLRGQPALEYLQQLFETLPTRDQRLVNEGLQVGRVISEFQDRRGRGDFLIRGVLGVHPEHQAIYVGDFVRTGQTIQFHVRDHASADLDFRQRLQQLARAAGQGAAGGLLFTCNGRGSNLFPEPDHDATAIQQTLGPLPLAGFFAAGELGPVGGENFVHGYTACLVVLRNSP